MKESWVAERLWVASLLQSKSDSLVSVPGSLEAVLFDHVADMQSHPPNQQYLFDMAKKKTEQQATSETTAQSAKKKTPSKKGTASKPAKKKSKPASPKNWTFPKNSLEDALLIARAIEDKNAGNPMKASVLVKAVGYNQSSDWRFLDMLRSANQYGLVEGSGQNATVSLAQIGEDVVAPSSSAQRQQALVEAFRNVDDFRQVEEFYGGKRIPEDEFFENTVVREFSIPRDRVKTFTQVFTDNLRYLNLFNARARNTEEPESSAVGKDEVSSDDTPEEAPGGRVREYLDTCFMMMPFGNWFDRYYHDIYVPAIKEAGFEPVRGDELFSTGTVVEQIWEEVQKSTVLLADLSERNANVFYELGLAHAAGKPVVLTAPQIDDVPFDLRHLRVIVYDIREPDWAAKLGKSVTDFLKNAKADPSKSIPQPFREFVNGGDAQNRS
ncbi:MAG: hypothetical protein AAF790_05330 [Planctomycetota bacterium]